MQSAPTPNWLSKSVVVLAAVSIFFFFFIVMGKTPGMRMSDSERYAGAIISVIWFISLFLLFIKNRRAQIAIPLVGVFVTAFWVWMVVPTDPTFNLQGSMVQTVLGLDFIANDFMALISELYVKSRRHQHFVHDVLLPFSLLIVMGTIFLWPLVTALSSEIPNAVKWVGLHSAITIAVIIGYYVFY